MPAMYILLLTVSLGAIWLFLRNSADVFVLAALTGLICFIWGFSCAPWTVQLMIVVLLLNWYKFCLLENQSLG